MAIPLIPILGGAAAAGLGALLGKSSIDAERRDREAARRNRSNMNAYVDLGNSVINPQAPAVTLPNIILPDYSGARRDIIGGLDRGQQRIEGAFGGARDALTGGYGSAADSVRQGIASGRQGLTDAFGNYRTDLTGAFDSRAQGLQQFRDELQGMFNFGEDPYARALLDFAQGDITARTGAATEATRAAFDDAVAAIMARGENIDPAAAAAQVQASFDQAALAAAAANAATAGDIAVTGQDVVGVGPATGEAADIQQYITGSGAISADAARANAQIAREAIDYLAGSTTKAGAARQGELQNLSAAAQADATQRFMVAEQERIAREREQFRQAEMGLRNEQLMLDSALREQLANAGFDVNRALGELAMQEGMTLGELARAYGSDLSGLLTQEGTTLGNIDISRGSVLGDIGMREEDARAAAENFWARERGEQAMAAAEQQQMNRITQQTIDTRLLGAASKSESEFVKQAEAMLADPNLQPFLYAMGIYDKDSAKAMYGWYRGGRTSQDPGGYPAPAPAYPSTPHYPGTYAGAGRSYTPAPTGNRPGQGGAARDGRTTGMTTLPAMVDTGRPGSGGRGRDGRTTG